MFRKILTIYVFIMFTEYDAKYSKYHKPRWQGTPSPWFGTYNPIAPEPLGDEDFMRKEEYQHILNMSIELIKDIYVKERYSKKIQKKYEVNIRYTLGLMVAGTIEKFTTMAKVFRYYNKPEITEVNVANERRHKHATLSMIQGYQIMQGEYNELRIESELFFDYLARKQKEAADAEANKDKEVQMTMTPEEFASQIDMAEFDKLSEAEQLQKLQELKESYGNNKMGRRRMAGGIKRPKLRFTPDAAQEEYKRSLRYQAWSKKWKGFNPKIEGIEISKPLAKLGRNISNFLNVNPF